MTYKQNITAILECYFAGFKEEIIDSACNRILEQKLEQEPKTAELRNVIEVCLRNVDGGDDYSIGQRNTLRWMLWCIDEGEEPEYEVIPKPKTGHWIEGQTDNPNIHNILCSCCFEGYPSKGHANSRYTREKFKYCSNCGAKMVVPQESSDKCSKCEYYINPDYTRCKECEAESEE